MRLISTKVDPSDLQKYRVRGLSAEIRHKKWPASFNTKHHLRAENAATKRYAVCFGIVELQSGSDLTHSFIPTLGEISNAHHDGIDVERHQSDPTTSARAVSIA